MTDGAETAVVFGGAGFVGRHLCLELRQRGLRAVSADVVTEGSDSVPADIAELRDVIRVIQEFRPDCVVNLAYLLGRATETDPYRATEVNVVGMANFFEAGRLLHVKRCVYASSIAVYGDQPSWGEHAVTEADHGRPAILYGWQKQLNEATATRYQRDHGLRCIGLRISRVFGPGQHTGSASPITRMIEAVARGDVAYVREEPDGASLIHVEDVAYAFATVMTGSGPRHDVYNTGGEFATMEMLAAMVRESVPEAQIDLGPVADRQAHVRRVDWTRLREEFAIIRPSLGERIAEWLRAERQSAVAL